MSSTHDTTQIKYPTLVSRIYGGWLGKSIGGTFGLHTKGKTGPLHFSFHDLVPVFALRNDDFKLQLFWLQLIEQRGFELTQQDFADALFVHIHDMDEHGRCRWNLRRGVPPAAAGTFENWFSAGMSLPTRSEIWACLCQGQPTAAARYAELDASLDHGPEGIAGEVYLAVLQSLMLRGAPLATTLVSSLDWIDAKTETAQAIRLALDLHFSGRPTWDAYSDIIRTHGHDNFTHTPLNLALISWALIYGQGDFETSLLLAINGGYDTECTAAAVGATLGMLLGPDRIDACWEKSLGEEIRLGPNVTGIIAADKLGDLTGRIYQLSRRFSALSAKPLVTLPTVSVVNLDALPGTIQLHPLDGSAPVAWANGELPVSVLSAGGAEWTWTVGPETESGCYLIALARFGARLLLDEEPIITCPTGVQFVPAVHRSDPASCVCFTPTKKTYRVRIELGSRDPRQEASVLLGTKAKHLTTWDGSILPTAPIL